MEILHYEKKDTLAQVAQRSCGCPIPGGVQGQAGWDGALGNLAWWEVSLPMAGGWNQMVLKVLSNPNHSVILCSGEADAYKILVGFIQVAFPHLFGVHHEVQGMYILTLEIFVSPQWEELVFFPIS